MRGSSELRADETGTTLVETMIAIILLGGGLLSIASAFAQAMVLMSTSHYHQLAKEKASEAVESVFTSRDTRVIRWNQIRNVPIGGVFLSGPQPLRMAGPDGLVNTADDSDAETETLPGPDGRVGTADDVVHSLDTFTREIQITDIAPNLRQIRVIVRYRITNFSPQYEIIAFISAFA